MDSDLEYWLESPPSRPSRVRFSQQGILPDGPAFIQDHYRFPPIPIDEEETRSQPRASISRVDRPKDLAHQLASGLKRIRRVLERRPSGIDPRKHSVTTAGSYMGYSNDDISSIITPFNLMHPTNDIPDPDEPITPTYVIPSPIHSELERSADYAKMDSPPKALREIALSTYVTRLREFFRELRNLPWVSPCPTVDYYPGKTGTGPPADPLSPLNWYAALHGKAIDLLSNGSSSSATATSTSTSPSAQLEDHPMLLREAPTISNQGFTMSQNHYFVNPQVFYQPPSVLIETRPGTYLPLKGVKVYGPPNFSQGAASQYSYPMPWPPAQPF